jgi:ABC-type amino acid transport substrate-binding protein
MFAVVTLALTPILSCEALDVVTLTGDPWPPYVVGELGSNADSGIAVDLVEQIFAQIPDTEVEFPLVPWNRALREVEVGIKDGIALLLKTPERERYLDYTAPLFTAYSLVWYKTEDFPEGFRWSTLEDFDRYTIGVVQGYSYGDAIDAAIESEAFSVTQVPTVELLFVMLARGRVDIALANDAVGYALANEHETLARIVPAARATDQDVFHLAFSKRTAARELIPTIDRIIADLREDGFIERLIKGKTATEQP